MTRIGTREIKVMIPSVIPLGPHHDGRKSGEEISWNARSGDRLTGFSIVSSVPAIFIRHLHPAILIGHLHPAKIIPPPQIRQIGTEATMA